MIRALGPILILIGMVLLGLIRVNFGGSGIGEGMQRRVDAMGIWGALLLGVVFALSFCPTSALLFLGLVAFVMGAETGAVTEMLSGVGLTLPDAPPPGGAVLLPLIYGVGTALPVLAFAFILALSAQSVGKAYNVLAKVDWWARMATGTLFVVIGIFFSLKYIFEVV